MDSSKPTIGASSYIENLPVSVMQALYHEITGNTETLSKGFKESRLIRKKDIEQLCIKLNQICGQYDVVGENTAISIRHSNSMVQKLSSLVKFTQYDENIPHCIDNVTIEHGVLIQVPSTRKHYHYKIDVVIESIEINHSREVEIPDFLLMFEFESIRVKIEYVDYVVARTFLATIEEWVEGLERIKPNWLLVKLQRLVPPRSPVDFLGRATDFIATSAALVAIYQLRDTLLAQPSNYALVNFGIVAFAILVATKSLLRVFYRLFLSRLLRYSRPNLILLNRGDSDNFDKFVSTKRSALHAVTIYAIQTIVIVGVNVLSNKIYDLVK